MKISDDIKYIYGALEDTKSGNGGYTYKSYLKYMMQIWCDSIMLKGLTSMWVAKITGVYTDTLYQVKYHHDIAACNANIILLYNSNYVHAHYITTLKVHGDNHPVEGYNRDHDDRMERAG